MVPQRPSHGPLFLSQRFLPMWTAFSLGVFADNMLRQALIIGIGFGAVTVPGLKTARTPFPSSAHYLRSP